MMKQLTAVLTAGCMTVLCLTAGGFVQERTGTVPITAEANDTKGENGTITYDLDGDGTLTISGSTAIADYDVLSGYLAPWSQLTPTKVVIKEGITGIGDGAFRGMSSITSVSIPGSVKSIGYYAFHNCTSLQCVEIPNGVTQINEGAFDACKAMTEVTIPETVTMIDAYAFNYCKSLRTVTIPASVRSIGKRAFNECSVLQSVTILNPSCDIYADKRTICNTQSGFSGMIIGAFGSTAQAFADQYQYQFSAAGSSNITPTEPVTTTAVTTTSTTVTTQTTTTTQTTAAPQETTTATETTADPGNHSSLALGDVNADKTINAKDAAEILIAAAKIGTNRPTGLSAEKETAADVDCNHVINSRDASAVLRYAAAIGAGIHEPIQNYT